MHWPTTQLTKLFNIVHPILQAPMASAAPPRLVAAVSNAGALGGFGGTDSSPEALRAAIRAIRRLTDRPFQVNLYMDHIDPYEPDAEQEEAIRARLAPHYRMLDLSAVPSARAKPIPFAEQLRVVLEERVPILNTKFGVPDRPSIQAIREAGIHLICTATTVAEAVHLAERGVSGVIAQGSEAGGHRGTFAVPADRAMIGTVALVPQVVDAVKDLPVIAAGGIMDARGVLAALVLGAAGVQMGTAFLGAPENEAVNPGYRRRLQAADATQTVVTRTMTGRPARLIRNALVESLEGKPGGHLAFPRQSSLTGPLREAAVQRDDAERQSLWAGQGVAMMSTKPAGEIVTDLARDTLDLIRTLRRRCDAELGSFA